MPSTNLCWIHSAKYLCCQDAQTTLSKPHIHPCDGKMDPRGLWSMEEGHRVGERVGNEEDAKNVLQKLPEKGAFEPAARQTDRKHPRHTPPSHTHLCLVDPRQVIFLPRAPRRAALSPWQVQRERTERFERLW